MPGDRFRRLVELCSDDFLRSSDKRWRPGEELVCQRPEGVDISAVIDWARDDLLRRHIGGGAHHHPRARHRRCGISGQGSGDPEVRQKDLTIGDQDVVRFDIAMDDASGVRIRQCVRQLAKDADDVPDGQGACAAGAPGAIRRR